MTRVDLTSFRKLESRSLRQLDACLLQRSARLSERKMRLSSSELEINSSNKYSFTVNRPNSLLSANLNTLLQQADTFFDGFLRFLVLSARQRILRLSKLVKHKLLMLELSFVVLRLKHWLTVLKPLGLSRQRRLLLRG